MSEDNLHSDSLHILFSLSTFCFLANLTIERPSNAKDGLESFPLDAEHMHVSESHNTHLGPI